MTGKTYFSGLNLESLTAVGLSLQAATLESEKSDLWNIILCVITTTVIAVRKEMMQKRLT